VVTLRFDPKYCFDNYRIQCHMVYGVRNGEMNGNICLDDTYSVHKSGQIAKCC
jgi:hypothetical protein